MCHLAPRIIICRNVHPSPRNEVKKYPGIDYEFRPESYSSLPDPLSIILRHIKGSNRRRMIRDYWNANALNNIDDQLLKDTLTADEMHRLGRVHPSFLGGELLPKFRPGEEEIVRIELDSVLFDVKSVRARPASRGIAWRVVDDYPVNVYGKYIIKPKITAKPPSLGELIEMLDNGTHEYEDLTGGLILGWNISQLGALEPAEIRGFTLIDSLFYPQLSAHCENVFDDWVAEFSRPEDGGGKEKA